MTKNVSRETKFLKKKPSIQLFLDASTSNTGVVIYEEKSKRILLDDINLSKIKKPLQMKPEDFEKLKFGCIKNYLDTLKNQYFITGVKTDAGKSRIIPIHNDILPIIQKYYNPKKHYFWDFNGSQRIYQTLRWRFDRLMKQLNIDHIPHDTRHTTATAMHNANLDIMYIKLILGHHINDITQRVYIHSNPKILVDEINKMKL